VDCCIKVSKLMNLDVLDSDLSCLVPTDHDENMRRETLHCSPSIVQVVHRSIKLSFTKQTRLLSGFKE